MVIINKLLQRIDEKMDAKGERAKAVWQFMKFNIVSLLASILQISLSYLLLAVLALWKSPLPEFIKPLFNEKTIGKGNANWGYVLPFLVSNLSANTFAYLMNRKTTFKSDAPKINFVIYLGIMLLLILFTTWLQGVIVNAICSSPSDFWQGLKALSPMISSLSASTLQFLVLFPLEKYVLLKENKSQ